MTACGIPGSYLGILTYHHMAPLTVWYHTPKRCFDDWTTMKHGKGKQRRVLFCLLISFMWEIVAAEEAGRRWAPLARNMTHRVTSAVQRHVSDILVDGKVLLTDASYALGTVAIAQALHTSLASPQGLVRQTFSSAVAPPTKLAWKQIAQIVETLQSDPSLRAWMRYPPHIIWQSLQAIRRLQRALQKEKPATELTCDLESMECQTVTKDLAYFSAYATLAYGWPMVLARIAHGQSRWRGGSRPQSLLQQSGLDESNIIKAEWQANTHRPAYLLVQDPTQKAIVLTVRGTWSASDILTDLCCTTSALPVADNSVTAVWSWLRPKRAALLEAHDGMVQAAVALKSALESHVASALEINPDYRLVLVGHSMGGGAAALLGLLWQNTYKPIVYVYGPPCVAPFDSPLTNHKRIHSVVLPGDPFCTLSLGHVTELAVTIDYFARHDALRRRICHRPVSTEYADEIWSLLQENVWSKRLPKEGSQYGKDSSLLSTKLVPPGQIWRLVSQKKAKRRWRVERTSTSDFLAFSTRSMVLDLTQHAPTLYESCLRQATNIERE